MELYGPSRYSETVLEGYRKFNNDLKKGLSNKVRISDLYTYINNLVAQNMNVYANNAHYTNAASKKIYTYLKSGEVTIGGEEDDDGSFESEEVIEDFYFETGTEGLLIFSSQYDWDAHPVKNAINIACSAIVSVCKYVILGILFFRMLILGLIISISPVLLIVNIFKRINGTTGFITRWIRLFIYLVFLRVMIYIIYYVLLRAFPSITKLYNNPIYIVAVCLVLDIFCIYTFIRVFKSMFRGGTKTRR